MWFLRNPIHDSQFCNKHKVSILLEKFKLYMLQTPITHKSLWSLIWNKMLGYLTITNWRVKVQVGGMELGGSSRLKNKYWIFWSLILAWEALENMNSESLALSTKCVVAWFNNQESSTKLLFVISNSYRSEIPSIIRCKWQEPNRYLRELNIL